VTTPRRVMLVTTSLMRGGAETQVFLIAMELRRRGVDVHVVSLVEPEAYVPELAAGGIAFSCLRMRPGLPDPRAVMRLARLVRTVRPDVVHSHMVHANLLARVVRLVAPMPVLVSTAHSFNEGARWRDLAYRWTDRMASLTTNVCAVAVDRYVQTGAVPRSRIRRVPNGLEPAEFARDEAVRARVRGELGVTDRFVWLAVGRLEPVKDYPTLFRALAVLRETAAPFTVLVVSGGPDRQALEDLRADLGLLPDELRFLGARRDVPALMSAADAYVMSSLWEGLPMVLLEAASAELPIVATRVGGNAEILDHGRSGYLVASGDSSALAASMARVAQLAPEERRAMGRLARADVVEKFHIRHVVDTWLGLYAELADGATTPTAPAERGGILCFAFARGSSGRPSWTPSTDRFASVLVLAICGSTRSRSTMATRRGRFDP
jgi:glycosyltransferase involved in cell wall biosynthesis